MPADLSLTERDVRTLLRQGCKVAGGYRPFGRAHRISPAYVQLVCAGRKQTPGPKILRALGLRRVVTYEKDGRRG